MPQRSDVKRILVIGSGPIVIGQAGEFDYSGSQAIKALKNLGYYVVVVNSNPATVMTDPEMADKTYIEPIETNIIEQIIKKEKIDSILPTVGGQTALNVTLNLKDEGLIDKYNIELLGVNTDSIRVAESRELFNNAMYEIGLECPKGTICKSYDDAMKVPDKYNYPLIIRPSFTLGGTGGGVAHTPEEYEKIVKRGLELSPTNELLIEESLIGWKEFEYEVIRDINDNVIIIASVENFDPMGVHTGDSITVAPAQTLTDKEYQRLRDYSIDIIRKIGVATGGSNIQFAVNPENGDVRVIEMNPRVSRSSALVSKATGFPIAKIAAQLAVGLTLDEITNEITGTTPASFEPTLDYIVVKIPRWDFEKFSVAPDLTTQMKSVGEVMSIGSNFREALQKAYRSLEIGVDGLDMRKTKELDDEELKKYLQRPTPLRPFAVKEAFERGVSLEKINEYTKIDPWFLDNMLQIVEFEKELKEKPFNKIDQGTLKRAKLNGFSDKQLAGIFKTSELEVRNKRKSLKVIPTYKKVDTCSAEFDAKTPYFYSTYLTENESERNDKKKIMVLGGGPFRIGQGIEFDYCASQAALILKEIGIETIMVNCNPETVSTDYDTSDKLYFEPVTYENVMDIIDLEKPDGIILQLGGQTPLNLSQRLKDENIKILGTSQENINLAENRGDFIAMLKDLDIPYPIGATVFDEESAISNAINIGFPVIVRPSYVLGGRGMEITYNEYEIKKYIEKNAHVNKENPVLIDKYLENSVEIDVDAISDGEDFFIAGIMQHIEEAGVHSGDSCSVLPAHQISDELQEEIKIQTAKLIKRLNIIGFINIQFVLYRNSVYVIEVNPRASRTVPYVSKTLGVPLTKLSVMLMLGKRLSEYNLKDLDKVNYYSVKSPVFSFSKFPGVDTVLGPEMRSTGEVMGISEFFGEAYIKSQISAGNKLPTSGNVFISVNDFDKKEIVPIAKKLRELGFTIFCTIGTHNALKYKQINSVLINKIGAGKPDVIELMENGDINLIINTPLGRKAYQDDNFIREQALQKKIHCITTLSAAKAAVEGIEWLQKNQIAIYGPVKDRIKIS
jgi:carbamoyl-phosphate synthase large subunit